MRTYRIAHYMCAFHGNTFSVCRFDLPIGEWRWVVKTCCGDPKYKHPQALPVETNCPDGCLFVFDEKKGSRLKRADLQGSLSDMPKTR